MFQCLVAAYPIDNTAGHFNYDILKVLENRLLDISTKHVHPDGK